MKIQSYNAELATASLLFSRLFRNISINRTLADNKIESCKVACVIGSRSRVLKAFENSQSNPQFTLPLIAITRTGIERDATRLNNLHNEIINSVHGEFNPDLYTPVPINITFKVSIYAKYTSDIDMILSNFLVFFNDDIYVVAQHPKYTDLRYYSQIIFQNTITETKNESLSATDLDLITAECSFKFKTYLFGGTKRVPISSYTYTRPITSVTTITALDENGDIIYDENGNISTVTSMITGKVDEVYDGFIPQITNIGLEFHGVPRNDPYIKAQSGLLVNYEFEQYLDDYNNRHNENADRKFDNPAVDYLDWIIQDATLIDVDKQDV